jgi:pimeloyl-ACP methyl ester carboxylesterase
MLKVANSSFMSATSTSITTSLPKGSRRSKRKSGARGGDKDNNASAVANRNPIPVPDKENFRSGEYGKDMKNGMRDSTTTNSQRHASAHTGRGQHGHMRHESAAQDEIGDAIHDAERQTTYDTRLTHAIWELATTGANPAVDLLICLERRHTIGFRYVDINRPVTIHHGSRDTRVPVDNVRWLGKTMRRCEVRVLEGEGHGLMASASVMGSVLMEISKEWEDWMRATGADNRRDKERPRRGTIIR